MKFERKLELLRDSRGVEPIQFAALCLRRKAGRNEVLMITSRDTGRWILPKGWRMDDRSEGETALTEAWEEAGVIGKVAGPPIGSYASQKMLLENQPMPCRVEVHPIHVDKLAARYPEKGQRRRKWISAKKAAKLVSEPELADILRGLR
ncbi:NUDIX hydrolase [Paenirhodobacter populi]|uniref:NUDIX hydrolase n=1 Tax=Paenirhodobacter populi TaxID=2306993 RepID=A0A443IVA4_9RHOB|nr:NUDIX hydrolase [Sinirhodobacter populi]RWR10141.1 NUDIX hydrolase [Sinirhodobacter populi]RWR12016.1 NUDIX hydrolase [Sinirhodobacter populi]RWR21664.1 NUDIX hydrolase [Sinirhodobacter populi]RWR30126.1 NUDIX hydrolase [Sinirhodobacter populi]RWR31646.1 NUDIX hydrolase [Sinirhodobacter populi]